MANTAGFATGWVDHYQIGLDLSETVNTSGNSSTITWTLKMRSESSSYSLSGTENWWVSINGANTYDADKNLTIDNSWVTIASGTTPAIAHNADGTKTVSVSYGYRKKNSYGAYTPNTMSGSGTYTLTKITRGDTCSLADNNSIILGSSKTVAFETTSYHLLQGFKDGKAIEIVRDISTVSYTLSAAQIDALSPFSSGPDTTFELRCYTYTGGKWNEAHTNVGTTVQNVTLGCPSSYGPVLGNITITEGSTKVSSAGVTAYLQNESRLKVESPITLKGGTTLKSCNVLIDNVSYNGQNVTSNILTKSGSISVKVTATDSRSRTTSKTVTVTVQAYSPPSISDFTVTRSSGSKVYICIKKSNSSVPGKAYSSSLKYRAMDNPNSYTTLNTFAPGEDENFIEAEPTTAFSGERQWEFTLVISDGLNVTERVVLLAGTFHLVSINSQHNAIGIGKSPDVQNSFDISGDMKLRYRSKEIIDLIYPIGSIFISTVSTNPQTYLGGTWVAFGAGRTLIGTGTNDSKTFAAGATGGSYTQAERALIGAVNGQTASIGYNAQAAVAGQAYTGSMGVKGDGTPGAISAVNHSVKVTDTSGNDPTTLQPYVVVYMFKRTA